MAVVGFEPTPPERLEPKSSALDHSATLPARISSPRGGPHWDRNSATFSAAKPSQVKSQYFINTCYQHPLLFVLFLWHHLF